MALLDGLGIDGNTAGLLGMAMTSKNPSQAIKKIAMMQMLSQNDQPQQPSYIEQNYAPQAADYMGTGVQAPTSTNPALNLPTNKQEMLQQLKASAVAAYPGNPTMQQVAMTQAIHESGLMGHPSQLASQYNNYFGIKAPGTAGSVNMKTNEFLNGSNQMVNAGFGRNANMGDSFMQHQHLMQNKRYQPVMAAQNPAAAFGALKQAGYATDPNYPNKLNATYQRYVAPLY